MLGRRFHRRVSWIAFAGLPALLGAVAAPDPAGHWAFQPVRDVTPPGVSFSANLTRSPIDAFVLQELEEHRALLAPPADARTLVRRAYFDLIGLPPSVDEAEQFVNDRRPDAFAQLVDRLLASPRYGERWGRWWLDLARYADSNGQDENKFMANAWRYRDWVIRAFNANLPFDRFATEQLAGDLLPTNGVSESAIFDRWTATGFLVLGPKMLAEQDKPKLVMDLVDEQIDVVSRAFLGLTVACARCHDHKFDPIPARDYYALAGIFKSTRAMENLDFVSKFNERRIATQEQLAALSAHEQALKAKDEEVAAAIKQANDELRATLFGEFPAYLAAATAHCQAGGARGETASGLDPGKLESLTALLAPDPATNSISRALRELAESPDRLAEALRTLSNSVPTAGNLRLRPGKIGAAFLATGTNHLELPHSLEIDPPLLTVEAWVRTEAFPKEGDRRRWLVNKNANEWQEGHYALVLDRDRPGAYLNIGGSKENVFAVWSGRTKLQTNRWYYLAFTYDGAVLRLFVDGQPAGETMIQRTRVPGTSPLALGRREDGYVNFQGRLDEVHVYNRALTAAELAARFENPNHPPVADVVARWEFNELSEAEQSALAEGELREALFGSSGVLELPADPRPLYPPQIRDDLARLEGERDRLKSSAPPPAAFALAVGDEAAVDLPIFVRGSHLSPGKDLVPRGFIAVAQRGSAVSIGTNQSGRLELARWLTSSDHPLTSRVVVNRVWQAHFGNGLVRTPDNFGLRGEAPTHPELLDWLAREFVRSGWDLKHLHRLMMNSATYQQSSGNGQMAHASAGHNLPGDGPASPSSVPGAVDPENRWLGHFPRHRLEAEMVRDALLAVSSRLDWAAGGSLVNWKNNEYVPKEEVGATSVRRSIYLPIVRDRVFDMLTIFDFANPSVGTAQRTPTVVSHQALFFLNSPLVKDCAESFARELVARWNSDGDRLQFAYERTLSRAPTEIETSRALEFLRTVEQAPNSRNPEQAWAALCQTLFASNEFLFRD